MFQLAQKYWTEQEFLSNQITINYLPRCETMYHNSPPVPIELPISKPEDLSPKVQTRMKQPVKTNQPDYVIGDLKERVTSEIKMGEVTPNGKGSMEPTASLSSRSNIFG